MKYRYRVLCYTYPDDPEIVSKLKGKLRNYTFLFNPDRASLHDALLMTVMTGGEAVIARSGDKFLIAPLQDVPPGWTSGEEFLIGRERGLEKVVEEIVGKEKANTTAKGALVVGLILLVSYAGYRFYALETINNLLLFAGVLLGLLGGMLKGYRKEKVRASAPPHRSE
ncbi:hypothetical protein [Thermococcus waiotapuensis]|uniref:Uncharacterized protein n=1 Tax=Thermococcus waiotapuensis TaxID=90909 RepID=A0AAE4SZ49_9EURY|nr:hypothetical protein [Thermococcus waiotapuensis]MDV3104439.1 hypothetical protein [Thermococcus waiotapuensis]